MGLKVFPMSALFFCGQRCGTQHSVDVVAAMSFIARFFSVDKL